jgi:undecaprenyl-diphosphatase
MEPRLERSQKHFEERGGASVFIGRFIGALRAVVPLTAGMSKMAFGRFLMWNVAASIIWAGGIVTVGYVAGKPAAEVFDRYALVFTGAIVLLALAVYLVRRARSSTPKTA